MGHGPIQPLCIMKKTIRFLTTGLFLWVLCGLFAIKPLMAQSSTNHATDGNGVLPRSMLESIRADHARTYSAIAVLEEYLLPGIGHTIKQKGSRHQAASFYVGFQSLFEATRSLDDSGIARPYDVHAFRIGLGGNWRKLGYYYAASSNFGYLLGGFDYERLGAMGTNFIIGYPYAAIAPFVGNQQLEDGVASVMTLDYVTGLSYDLGIANVGLGYVGSTGFYYTIYENRINAYLRGLFQSDSFQNLLEERNLNYLVAGVEQFDYFLAHGRQGFADLEYVLSTWRLPDGRKLADRRLGRISQRDIFGVLDLNTSYSWKPSAEVSELTVTLHTYGFHQDLAGVKSYGRGGYYSYRSNWGIAAGIQGGFVTLPDLPEFMIRGGKKPSYSAEMVLFSQDRHYYRFYLRQNHRETLELFPYAHGAWDFGFDIVLNI